MLITYNKPKYLLCFSFILILLICVGCEKPDNIDEKQKTDTFYDIENNDFATLAENYNALINNYILSGDYEKGFSCANEFLDKVLAADDSTAIPEAYYNIGRLYFGLGLSETALDFFLQMTHYKLPPQRQCALFYAIAETSRNSELVDGLDSEEYYKKSEMLARELNDSIRIANALFGQSQMYFESLEIYQSDQKSMSSSKRDSLNRSIRLLEESLKYAPDLYITHVALGLNYTAKNEFDKGLYYAQKGYDVMLAVPDLIPLARNVMASINAYMGKYTEAIQQAQESYDFAKERNKKGDMRNSSNILYHIYRKAGDDKKALKAYEQYITLQNELTDQERRINLIYTQVKYDTQLKEERLADAEARNKVYLAAMYIITALLLIVSGLLVFSYRVFKKKQNAYRKLVDKTELWANTDKLKVTTTTNGVNSPTEEDKRLTKEVHRLMITTKIFKNTNLTLETLAEELSVNRNTLSKAINSTTNKNFNNFINEYRIKEAVKLMSSPRYADWQMDELIENTGFNSRTTFYVAFKKITGLSPSEYKNNKVTS